MKKSTSMTLLVLGGLVLVGVLAGILSLFLSGPDTEIEIGIIIVIAVAALMLLLFIMAAGFTILNLSDSKQALGLPEGSIRAMIALILVLVFIICGTYLFRLVGTGYATTYANQTSDQLQKIQGKILRITPNSKSAENFDVIVQSELNTDAIKLAQQLVTTIGTLVVAVAGFYFGSASTSSAVAAVQRGQASKPVLQSVNPAHGTRGDTIDFQVVGSDLNRTQKVRLVRGNEEMVCTDVSSNSSGIKCKFKVDKDPGDKWDVTVSTDDGAEVTIREVFSIDPDSGNDSRPPSGQAVEKPPADSPQPKTP
jgi:hypothetical protein